MSRAVVIINPHAGRQLDVGALVEQLRFLTDPVVRLTTRAGEARAIARDAAGKGAELIVAAGGDGTLHEVVNGLGPEFEGCRLGIIPTGTGNDGARSLGLPLEVEGAVDRLQSGQEARVDVMRIEREGGSSFALNAVTGGFGGIVNDAMTEELKAWWGPLAYARAAGAVASAPPVFALRLTFDGAPEPAIRVMSLVVANGETAAGGVYVAPGALMTDGRLSVHAVLESSLSEIVSIAPTIMRGQIPEKDHYRTWECEALHLVCDDDLPMSVDGELIEAREIEFRVLPSALAIVGATPGAL